MAKRMNPNPWLVVLVAALVGALLLVVAWVAWGIKPNLRLNLPP